MRGMGGGGGGGGRAKRITPSFAATLIISGQECDL